MSDQLDPVEILASPASLRAGTLTTHLARLAAGARPAAISGTSETTLRLELAEGLECQVLRLGAP